jgi:hypothetical protein
VTVGIGRDDDDDNETGPIIPDLDDVQDEDMALQVFIFWGSVSQRYQRLLWSWTSFRTIYHYNYKT